MFIYTKISMYSIYKYNIINNNNEIIKNVKIFTITNSYYDNKSCLHLKIKARIPIIATKIINKKM